MERRGVEKDARTATNAELTAPVPSAVGGVSHEALQQVMRELMDCNPEMAARLAQPPAATPNHVSTLGRRSRPSLRSSLAGICARGRGSRPKATVREEEEGAFREHAGVTRCPVQDGKGCRECNIIDLCYRSAPGHHRPP